MPSDSRMRISSSLMTWPFANNFFPPDRNTVQQRILPLESLTSTVLALMSPRKPRGLIISARHIPTSRLYRDRVCLSAMFLVILWVNLWGRTVLQWGYCRQYSGGTDSQFGRFDC